MKQRKSPVALLTVAVVAVAGLIVAAKPFSEERLSNEEKGKLYQERMQEAQKAAQAAAPKQVKADATAEATRLRADLKAKVGQRPTMKNPEEDGGIPADPTILLPEDKVTAPIRNDSATSSQWYPEKN